jgi:hypothetical protein
MRAIAMTLLRYQGRSKRLQGTTRPLQEHLNTQHPATSQEVTTMTLLGP